MESAGVGWGRRPRPIRCRNMVGERVAATCEAREVVIPREQARTKPRLLPPAAPFGLFRGSYLGFPELVNRKYAPSTQDFSHDSSYFREHRVRPPVRESVILPTSEPRVLG